MEDKKVSGSTGRRLLLLGMMVAFSVGASAEWKEKVLYSFQGGTTDGSVPAGGVVLDSKGNLYGATTHGGPETCTPIGYACGTAFEVTPPAQNGGAWTETLIYQFQGEGSKDASVPTGGLVFDAAGNLYGVTAYGGTGDCVLEGIKAGCGTVFKLSPPKQKNGVWTETILYSFHGGNDGYFPWGNLVFDRQGNIYGATQFGGGKGTTCNIIYGGQCGTVYKLSPPKEKGGKWTENVLHRFKSGTDGANPNGGLILDDKGVIDGTTYGGGNERGECGPGGCGTVFTLQPPTKKGAAWGEKVLHRFNGRDGSNPNGGLVASARGALYGTAQGGPKNEGDGIAFRLTAIDDGGWKETVLHVFSRDNNGGASPLAGLTIGAQGDLYGTASWSHVSSGDVFRIEPSSRKPGEWTLGVLYSFTGPPDGSTPGASLIFDTEGNLYSTTQMGGAGTCGCGTVFEVSP